MTPAEMRESVYAVLAVHDAADGPGPTLAELVKAHGRPTAKLERQVDGALQWLRRKGRIRCVGRRWWEIVEVNRGR